jgi:rRNA-processing protein FCF1
MFITPRPGVNRDNLLKTLQSVHTDVFNLRGGGGPARTAHDRWLAYLEWTSNAVRMLGNQISESDLNRLVLTDRYRLLLGGAVGTLTGTEMQVQRTVNGLVSLELDERVTAFDAAIQALRSQILRWSGYGHYVVPDTSFYVHHPDKLEGIDPGALLGDPHADFVVMVPMVIVDELDRLKETKDKQARWRAGYTLAVLDRLFERRVSRALLRKGETEPVATVAPLGDVWIELLFEPPGHVRLPNSDDEIIDRALGIEPLADRKVTLLTYDTGQSTRARNAGLQVLKLRQEIGEEPT